MFLVNPFRKSHFPQRSQYQRAEIITLQPLKPCHPLPLNSNHTVSALCQGTRSEREVAPIGVSRVRGEDDGESTATLLFCESSAETLRRRDHLHCRVICLCKLSINGSASTENIYMDTIYLELTCTRKHLAGWGRLVCLSRCLECVHKLQRFKNAPFSHLFCPLSAQNEHFFSNPWNFKWIL